MGGIFLVPRRIVCSKFDMCGYVKIVFDPGDAGEGLAKWVSVVSVPVGR